ncbi:MAG: small basic protein [Candidatus Brocadiales bacterium]
MSIDKSLAIKGRLGRARSVLRRAERVKTLETEGRWKEGDSVFGLPKVKSVRIKKKSKAVKGPPKEATAPEAEAAPTGE